MRLLHHGWAAKCSPTSPGQNYPTRNNVVGPEDGLRFDLEVGIPQPIRDLAGVPKVSIDADRLARISAGGVLSTVPDVKTDEDVAPRVAGPYETR